MQRSERETVLRAFMEKASHSLLIEESLTAFLSEMTDCDFLTDTALIEAFLKWCVDRL